MSPFSGIPYLHTTFQDGSSDALSTFSELLTADEFCLIKMTANPNGHRCDYVVQLKAEPLVCKRTDAEGDNPRMQGI